MWKTFKADAPLSAAINGISVAKVADREFRVTASGLWSPEYADAHFGDLNATLAAARTPNEGVRVLVDLRTAAVQQSETARRIAYWTETMYRADDRVAMLVASSLVKMQMRRVAVITTRELFLSESAAETWLRAGQHRQDQNPVRV